MSDETKQSRPPETDTSTVVESPLSASVPQEGNRRAVRSPTIDAVKIVLAAEIGRASMSIKEVREARQGSIITLDREVGEPVDIRANGQLIARGIIVATEGRRYGVRLTEVVTPGAEDPEE